MATFHTEWNEEHRDWQCRCGIAMGVGATPEEATLACLKDLENGFSESIGWLGTPKKRNPPVIVEFVGGPFMDWRAAFPYGDWGSEFIGYGETPEKAVDALMRDVSVRHNCHNER